MKLLLDLHTHSLKTAGAAGSTDEMIAAAQKKQLAGIAITDVEFLNDNAIKQTAGAEPFLLIPGIEYDTEFGRVLGLFVERQPYLPEYQRKGNRLWVFSQTVKAIRKAGGIPVLAQPGREELTLEMWAEVDAWEAGNSHYQCLVAGQEPERAELFLRLCQEKPLPSVAGSDSYFPEEIGNAWTEINVPDDFWEYSREQQQQLVRAALLQGQQKMQVTRVHPYFIKWREYNFSKLAGKSIQMPLLWLQKNKARRDYQKALRP